MKKNRKILYNVLSVFFISSTISCMPINVTEPGTAVKTGKAEPPPMALASAEKPAAAPAAPAAAKEGADLYAQSPEPLTVAQCAQCHTGVFNKIKNDGGRHRINCQDCHQQFHSYNPVKNNWNEIMPKCSQCHTQPHGPNFLDCMTCHIIPHTPLNVPMNDMLANQCGNCHSGPSGQLTQFPSAHTEQGCTACHHTKHGAIPSCMECHEPHIPDQPVEACKSCHPVHRPLDITYKAGTEATCGACHDQVYKVWVASPSKHSGVACAKCHEKHGQIPQCTNCHKQPHDPKMLEKFPSCLDCHINAHNPPINK